MSDAFEQWAQDKSFMLRVSDRDGYVNVKEMAREVWQAALQSGEPVAWMSPNKQSLEFSRPDTVYGSHTIPLYTTPQPVVPEGYVLVPINAFGEWFTEGKGGEPT